LPHCANYFRSFAAQNAKAGFSGKTSRPVLAAVSAAIRRAGFSGNTPRLILAAKRHGRFQPQNVTPGFSHKTPKLITGIHPGV
jgi:hypothetical protein